MNIAALVVFTVFYGSYLTKSFLLKRRGIAVNRMGKGKKPERAVRTERLLLASAVLMAAVQILTITNVISSIGTALSIKFIGLILSVTGLIFFLSALVSMKESWRAGIDDSMNTVLQTGGIMRISRNPAFLGFDLFNAGVAVTFTNPIIISLTILCIVFFHLQILEEEKFLHAKFPDAYAEYRSRVRRYL